MPYIQRTVKAGKTIEVFKYYSYRTKAKGVVRSGNFGKTPENVAKVNQRNAENRLRWLINANFGEGDYYITLTYKRELRKRPSEAKKALSVFFRRLRKKYRDHDAELKYIAVTEYENIAVHHHLILNNVFNGKEIVSLWEYGRPCIKFLDGSGDYGQLAAYLIKETSKTFGTAKSPLGQRYSRSRNLIEPEIEEKIIQHEKWCEIPKPKKGYYILQEPEIGVHETSGYGFMHYVMVMLE